jgi:hypothetical protein
MMLMPIGRIPYAIGVKKHYYQYSAFINPPTNFYPEANLDDKLDFPGLSYKHLTE